MDLVLNSLERLICHKTQLTNQSGSIWKFASTGQIELFDI